ncbi:MAG: hypothetical protein NZ560_02355 [Aquificaceae bacterium]|nr:hypothetical protein [Aquificaceae bacterium]
MKKGKEKEIQASELVPGEDIRLIESAGLLVDESMLTGSPCQGSGGSAT